MPKFTQFEEDIPIITAQSVSTRAEGLEAISKTLGGISSAAMKEAKEIGEDQSNIMSLQTQAHADSIKNDALIKMTLNPDMSTKIFDKASEEYSTTIQQAIVNDADRAKLKYIASKDINDIKLKAAQTQFQNAKIEGQIALLASWPGLLDELQKSGGDENLFNIRLKTAQDAIKSALKSHSITIGQANTLNKSLTHIIKAQNEYHKLYGNKNVTAQEHNRVATTIVDQNNGYHGLPGDQTIIQESTEKNTDTTARGIESDAASGRETNPVAWLNIPRETQLNQVSNYVQGAKSVEADLKTGVSFAGLDADYKELKVMASPGNYERGRRDRLKNIIMSKGLFHQVMKYDGQYQYYQAEYNQHMSAVAKQNLSDEQKINLAKYYDNDFAHKTTNLASARNLLDEHISPIPYNYIKNGQSSFVLDKDLNSLKMTIGYWDHDLREYFASGMETPVQQEVARAVGNLLDSGITDASINNLILANQEGRDYKSLTEHEPGQSYVSQPILRRSVSSKISGITEFIGKQTGGATRVDSVIEMTANLAKILALQHNDMNPDNYSQAAADIVKKAYPISNGVTWTKNDKDFPWLESQQMDILSNYLINYVKENILLPGRTEARMSVALDANNLKVVGTPTGKFAVIDSFGNVIHITPYSSNLLSLAYVEREKKFKKAKEEVTLYKELGEEIPVEKQVKSEYQIIKEEHKKEFEKK